MFEAAVLSEPVFHKLQRLVYDRAGIDLREGKQTLVGARLGKKLREWKLGTYEELMHRLDSDRSGDTLTSVIDALTTNFTFFLREQAHFDFLRDQILPNLASRGSVEIWCAAAATGEEPYSLAFTILDKLGSAAASRCRILATDISTRALAAARQGTYPAERFEALPGPWKSRYLLRGDGANKGLYRVKPEVMRMVEFARLNLNESFSHARPFPLISCRNVMIYFDKATQEKVVQRLAACLEPGGYLFIGHSESLTGIAHALKFVQPAIYRKA